MTRHAFGLQLGQPDAHRFPKARAARVQSPRVAGKSLLAVSAIGMSLVLVSLCRGQFGGAAAVLLLTFALLEVMFHRAVSRFHAPFAQASYTPGAEPRPTPGTRLSTPIT